MHLHFLGNQLHQIRVQDRDGRTSGQHRHIKAVLRAGGETRLKARWTFNAARWRKWQLRKRSRSFIRIEKHFREVQTIRDEIRRARLVARMSAGSNVFEQPFVFEPGAIDLKPFGDEALARRRRSQPGPGTRPSPASRAPHSLRPRVRQTGRSALLPRLRRHRRRASRRSRKAHRPWPPGSTIGRPPFTEDKTKISRWLKKSDKSRTAHAQATTRVLEVERRDHRFNPWGASAPSPTKCTAQHAARRSPLRRRQQMSVKWSSSRDHPRGRAEADDEARGARRGGTGAKPFEKALR